MGQSGFADKVSWNCTSVAQEIKETGIRPYASTGAFSLHQLHPSLGSRERHTVCAALLHRYSGRMKLIDSGKMGRLVNSEPGFCRELVQRREGDPQRACFSIPNETIELSGVQSKPEADRGEIHASPQSIF